MAYGGQPLRSAVVFGATGGIGAALVATLAQDGWDVVAASRSGASVAGSCRALSFDLLDEESIAQACAGLAEAPPELVIVATGALTLPGGRGPERSLRALDPAALAEGFAINAAGPALIAKHLLPLMARDRRTVFAAFGARVGSIGDNRLGGWHAYRASKAALAMLLRTIAIEHVRTHPRGIVVGYHPGTVDTGLSRPFQRNLPEGQLMTADAAARACLGVLGGLGPTDSGRVVDWRGEIVPP